MLIVIQQFINKLIAELDRNIVIENVIFYEKAKLEYALSTVKSYGVYFHTTRFDV